MKVFSKCNLLRLLVAATISVSFLVPTNTTKVAAQPSQATDSIHDADYIMLAPVPGLVKGDCDFSDPTSDCTTDTATFLKGIFQFFIGLAGALAVLLIMWEGFQYVLTAKEKDKTKARQRIQDILVGLLIAVGSVVILNFIDPTFTQFKFRFPEKEAVQEDAELTAFYNNLINRAAQAQTETSAQVNTYNQQLTSRRTDLNTLTANRAAATSPTEQARYDAAIADTRRQISISEELDRKAAEIKQLADRGAVSAAEDKLREMSLYFDAQARGWTTSAPGTPEERAEIQRQQQSEIRKEGATRQREVYLYVSQVRLRQATQERP